MAKITWANIFHIYQPPDWNKAVVLKVVRESYQPFFQKLIKHPNVKITLNICGSLTEQLYILSCGPVLENIRLLAERGQIEFTASMKYHALLPFIPESEIKRQVQLNYDINRKLIGATYKPKGFFLPEMCYSRQSADVIARLGHPWIILDEISYNGKVGEVSFDEGYSLDSSSLKIIFRNRDVSDMFFMDILKSTSAFHEKIEQDNRSNKNLITSCDGENLGHHNPALLKVWFDLVSSPKFTTVTISEVLSSYTKFVSVKPVPSSWASRESELKNKEPYYLWESRHNLIQTNQWKLTKLVLQQIKHTGTDNINYQRARNLLDKALASDQYWWASASPWWNVEIISVSSAKLIRVLHLLGVNKTVLSKANKYYDNIIKISHQWQSSGKAEQSKKNYLASEDFTRYFGGEKVN
ncbi:hypothetical protein KKG41_01385 [Patescibacteria group bacterium]|nr:hypothetical protein [Patescibacteria group bacterium]